MGHLSKDKRERRVREAAALPGADEAGGQVAAFVTDIAYDEPLTGDLTTSWPDRSGPVTVPRALPRAGTWRVGAGPRWLSTSRVCTADPQNVGALIVRDGVADAVRWRGVCRA
jgi:hypothetical protein